MIRTCAVNVSSTCTQTHVYNITNSLFNQTKQALNNFSLKGDKRREKDRQENPNPTPSPTQSQFEFPFLLLKKLLKL